MDNSNIVKLARIFENFIEFDSSFVLRSDIKAITAHKSKGAAGVKGMDIVTPYGTFHDKMEFSTFKSQLGVVLEAYRDRRKEEESKPKPKIVPIEDEKSIFTTRATTQTNSNESSSPIPMSTNVSGFGKDGANGKLFSETDLEVVNRSQLTIHGPNGEVLAKGTESGQIMGDSISGIIYKDGRYTLADKGAGVQKVLVKYYARRK